MALAGYSGTPLPKKLGLKPGCVVALLGAPAGFMELLGPLPDGITFVKNAKKADVVLAFATSRKDFEPRFAAARAAIGATGAVWAAWPKKASGVKTDLDEGAVRAIGLSSGLVDVKVCAIDDVWSGLRFVVRLRDR